MTNKQIKQDQIFKENVRQWVSRNLKDVSIDIKQNLSEYIIEGYDKNLKTKKDLYQIHKQGNYSSKGWGIKRFEEGGKYDLLMQTKWKYKSGEFNTGQFIKEVVGKTQYKKQKELNETVALNKGERFNFRTRGLEGSLKSILQNNSEFYESSEQNKELIRAYNKGRKLGIDKNDTEFKKLSDEIGERYWKFKKELKDKEKEYEDSIQWNF